MATAIATAPNGLSNGTAPIKAKTKNQYKRLKSKQRKAAIASSRESSAAATGYESAVSEMETDNEGLEPAVEYVPEALDVQPGMEAFSDVFARFQLPSESEAVKEADATNKPDVIYSDDDMPSDEEGSEGGEAKPVSKRKQAKMNRLSVAELKQLVKKPEVVEWTDVSAADPRLLIHLKSYRNTVPVPPHWSAKRDYLQGKRGIEKAAFQLPSYYEGKEFETSLKEKRPGELSQELVEALSIPPLAPPPWLISMQRFGPPPSYPTLRIPGLNAPIPEGAQWGFHPGGWGKPPLDEYNRPLYGDVFGALPKPNDDQLGEPIDKELWGELEPEEEEEEESEEESEEEDEDETTETAPTDGLQTPSGLETPSGLHSVVSTVPGGLETPDFLELRKTATRSEDTGPRQLYHVVPEKQTTIRGLVGSERGYDVSGIAGGAHVPVLGEERGTKRKTNGVEISLDASELEGLSDAELRARYDAVSRGSAGVPGGASREDFSDMIAKEMRERDRKRQRLSESRSKGKEKDFKF
ncbi:hypothetical protein FS837_002138 [Tulasnella sp. UAMH 9824]|nr:hypothetical protein FS837_002138 [Tulasnella sp. UAMH 9824]